MLGLADAGTKPLSSAKVKRGARMPAGTTVQCIMWTAHIVAAL
jgi:hypothetical protein